MPNPDPSYVKSGDPVTALGYNSVVASIRRLDNSTPRQPLKTGGSGGACPFGRLTSIEGESAIIGGMVYVGDKNYTVEPYIIDVAAAGKKYIYLEIPCEVNRDDNNQLMLPHIKTSTWTPAYEDDSTKFPDNVNPVVDTGIGTIIIPIAIVVTTTSGLSSFEPSGCGNITVDHCMGSLSFTRS